MKRPAREEYNAYYHEYIKQVPDGHILDILEKQADLMGRFFANISEEQGLLRYEPGKWSIKEIVGHLLDVERIFAYRAFRFSRNDKTDLPGFDQNSYVPKGRYDTQDLSELIEAFYVLRKATINMFKGFDAEMWEARGTANGSEMSVRAVAWLLAGHLIHHMKVIQSRYLSK
ncbi:MAG: DinB family protein [Calditrichaeota bacterium]|nr:MAG: DinB family protein [Calditrichota bacterium]